MTGVNQKAALALGALTGAAAALLLGRRKTGLPASAPPTGDTPGDALQRELAEARDARVDEAEFHAAGMGAETIVTEDAPGEAPPANEFEAMRRRVHEEARAAADEMRRRAETTD